MCNSYFQRMLKPLRESGFEICHPLFRLKNPLEATQDLDSHFRGNDSFIYFLGRNPANPDTR
jgi:hypothetical protein